MVSEKIKNGLAAINPENRCTRIITNAYPAIPDWIEISIYKLEERSRAQFTDAKEFLQLATVDHEETSDEDRDILSIKSKAESFKLYEFICAQAQQIKAEGIQPRKTYGKSPQENINGILWNVFDPWLERALELPMPKGYSGIIMRMSQSPDSALVAAKMMAKLISEGVGEGASRAVSERVAEIYVMRISQVLTAGMSMGGHG